MNQTEVSLKNGGGDRVDSGVMVLMVMAVGW